jgi:hypothetical protein
MTESPKLKPRWFQISLRTLLLLVTLAAATFGWLGLKLRHAREEQRAAKVIHQLGGYVTYDFQIRTGRYQPGSIDTNAAPPGPQWLCTLLGDDLLFAHVVRVNLNIVTSGRSPNQFASPAIRDVKEGAFGALRSFKHLKFLNANDTAINDADLTQVGQLVELQELHLRNSKVTSLGLRELVRLSQLRRLTLSNTLADDKGLSCLGRFAKLEVLLLDSTPITDAGLANLSQLEYLQILSLNDTHVGDLGLTHLQDLHQLEWLYLKHTDVSDAGLSSLDHLTNLHHLFIHGTRVTPAGCRKLQTSIQGLWDVNR